jgi:hypothetical protein
MQQPRVLTAGIGCAHSPQWRCTPFVARCVTSHVVIGEALPHVVQQQICEGLNPQRLAFHLNAQCRSMTAVTAEASE